MAVKSLSEVLDGKIPRLVEAKTIFGAGQEGEAAEDDLKEEVVPLTDTAPTQRPPVSALFKAAQGNEAAGKDAETPANRV